MSETGRERPSPKPRPTDSGPPGGLPESRLPGSQIPRHEPRQAQARFSLLLALARGAVASDTLWPALWPLLDVLSALLAVPLFDVLPALNLLLHSPVLADARDRYAEGKTVSVHV